MSPEIDTVVLSASGYAGAEALRLVVGHPHLRLVAAVSHTRPGTPIREVLPHLAQALPATDLVSLDQLEALLDTGDGPIAILGCGPHGRSAPSTVRALEIAESLGRPAHAVDLAADFRHPIPTFETLYAQCHPAPTRAADFHCGLPDLDPSPTTPHAAHPGCFATAVTLACAPLLAAGWVEPVVRASAVTGSTGSGGTPKPGTHHPTRHGNLWGYKPLAHRHAPEMSHLLASLGGEPVQVHFAPHSGPFARGIAATCFLALTRTASPEELSQVAADFYAHSPFVEVVDAPPRLDAVIGTNRCQLHLASNGTEVVVQSVIDNLVKGASGGAIHWLNRLFGLPQTAGLDAAPLPWS